MIVGDYMTLYLLVNNMFLNIILLLNLGLADGKMEPFIVGGDYIDIRQFPHSIYLYMECVSSFICGGSVLTSHIVITAAHCLCDCLDPNQSTIIINYGHHSMHHMKSLLVSKFSVHEKYNDDVVENDIGLLYSRVSINLGDMVKRVAILRRFPTRATGGYVTGWGVINEEMETALTMKYVYQELQNREMCESLIRLPPGTFCGRSNMRGEYPDQGDSGGAFIVYNFIQIGIVSFKHINYELIAYTNVTYHYNWIKKKAKTLSCT